MSGTVWPQVVLSDVNGVPYTALNPVPIAIIGSSGSDGSSTVTLGGTAQNLFAGAVPANGFSVFNSDSSEELWVSLSIAAAPNAAGSIRIPALGLYETPDNMKPFHAISIYGATTGHKFTATQW